ncbi:hypothetical protein Tco_0614533 [Tanacetum coccineum]
MNDNILNNNEWKKSDYGNPLNTATDSFFKTHDEHDIEEGNELKQMKRKEDNKNDEQPNKRGFQYGVSSFYGYCVLVYLPIAAKKSTKLVKYQSSGILFVIVVMLDAFTTHILAHKLNLENLLSKISGEFLILILLIPIFNALSIQRGRCIIQVRGWELELIMEYLVKISKKARILELKRRHLKITVLTSNTPYPSRKIRRICACTSQKTTKETRSYTPYPRKTDNAVFKI